jgi:hypothetical protein
MDGPSLGCGDRGTPMTALPLLLLPVLLAAGTAWGAPYQDTLRQQDVTFEVKATDEGSIQLLQVRARKRRQAYRPVKQELIGRVVGARAKDLNGDGRPELVVIVRSVGSGSYGGVQAWSAGTGRTLEPIALPDLSGALAVGYMGHDAFEVGETGLKRSFPIYRPGDSQAKPTGGRRTILYTLAGTDSGWVFQPGRVTTAPTP